MVTPCSLDDLPRLRERAVAARLGRHVDDDRALAHLAHHVFGEQPGAGLPGMSAVVMMMSTSFACSANSAISAAMNSLLISWRSRPARCRLPRTRAQELGAHALHLLLDGRRVSNARTMAPRPRAAPIAARPATPAPITQHLGRRHLARRRHLPGEEATVKAGRLDDRAVAGDVRHRAQRVHLLGARDARHLIDGEHGGLARRAAARPARRWRREDEADERRAGLSRSTSCSPSVGLCSGGCTLSTRSVSCHRAATERTTWAPAASYAASLIDEPAPAPAPTDTSKPELQEPLDRLRRRCNTPLAGVNLSRDGYFHSRSSVRAGSYIKTNARADPNWCENRRAPRPFSSRRRGRTVNEIGTGAGSRSGWKRPRACPSRRCPSAALAASAKRPRERECPSPRVRCADSERTARATLRSFQISRSRKAKCSESVIELGWFAYARSR